MTELLREFEREALRDCKSKRRDRERDSSLSRGERIVRLALHTIVTLAFVYVLLRHQELAPWVVGGFGVGGGAIWFHDRQKARKDEDDEG